MLTNEKKNSSIANTFFSFITLIIGRLTFFFSVEKNNDFSLVICRIQIDIISNMSESPPLPPPITTTSTITTTSFTPPIRSIAAEASASIPTDATTSMKIKTTFDSIKRKPRDRHLSSSSSSSSSLSSSSPPSTRHDEDDDFSSSDEADPDWVALQSRFQILSQFGKTKE